MLHGCVGGAAGGAAREKPRKVAEAAQGSRLLVAAAAEEGGSLALEAEEAIDGVLRPTKANAVEAEEEAAAAETALPAVEFAEAAAAEVAARSRREGAEVGQLLEAPSVSESLPKSCSGDGGGISPRVAAKEQTRAEEHAMFKKGGNLPLEPALRLPVNIAAAGSNVFTFLLEEESSGVLSPSPPHLETHVFSPVNSPVLGRSSAEFAAAAASGSLLSATAGRGYKTRSRASASLRSREEFLLQASPEKVIARIKRRLGFLSTSSCRSRRSSGSSHSSSCCCMSRCRTCSSRHRRTARDRSETYTSRGRQRRSEQMHREPSPSAAAECLALQQHLNHSPTLWTPMTRRRGCLTLSALEDAFGVDEEQIPHAQQQLQQLQQLSPEGPEEARRLEPHDESLAVSTAREEDDWPSSPDDSAVSQAQTSPQQQRIQRGREQQGRAADLSRPEHPHADVQHRHQIAQQLRKRWECQQEQHQPWQRSEHAKPHRTGPYGEGQISAAEHVADLQTRHLEEAEPTHEGLPQKQQAEQRLQREKGIMQLPRESTSKGTATRLKQPLRQQQLTGTAKAKRQTEDVEGLVAAAALLIAGHVVAACMAPVVLLHCTPRQLWRVQGALECYSHASSSFFRTINKIPISSSSSFRTINKIPICSSSSFRIINKIPISSSSSFRNINKIPVCSSSSFRNINEKSISSSSSIGDLQRLASRQSLTASLQEKQAHRYTRKATAGDPSEEESHQHCRRHSEEGSAAAAAAAAGKGIGVKLDSTETLRHRTVTGDSSKTRKGKLREAEERLKRGIRLQQRHRLLRLLQEQLEGQHAVF
ncbi:hypothetical protein cyc_02082 [Cyclospora cayetanensis]|uniref:Uncharacterized protein n=1 Tax=Cyclospora cayetanensis TaxID=88456 RepID=A0A1D3D055_9EIME|nr:hypothetical protein cyc_02082 [Cyclospora cayetanensis]